jgi:hypothetical protein
MTLSPADRGSHVVYSNIAVAPALDILHTLFVKIAPHGLFAEYPHKKIRRVPMRSWAKRVDRDLIRSPYLYDEVLALSEFFFLNVKFAILFLNVKFVIPQSPLLHWLFHDDRIRGLHRATCEEKLCCLSLGKICRRRRIFSRNAHVSSRGVQYDESWLLRLRRPSRCMCGAFD